MSQALSASAALLAGLLVLPGAAASAAQPGTAVPFAVLPEDGQVEIPEEEQCPEEPLDEGESTPHVDGRGPLPGLLDLDRVGLLATGKGVGVAVVDVGVEVGHSSLDVRLQESVGGLGKGLHDSHGTLVAGLIAGRNEDGKQLGVAPGAHIVSIKVADARAEKVEASDGQLVGVDAIRVADGITRAVDLARGNGIKVINVSLNLEGEHPAVTSAINAADRAGILVVASVGNRPLDEQNEPDPAWKPGEDNVQPPATHPKVLGVTGLGADHTLDPRLVWTGKQVDVSAPSYGAVTVAPGGGTCRIAVSGSSWAAAEVSGLAALIFEKFQGIRPQQVAARIMATAQGGVDAHALDGHGMVQPLDALTAQLDISPAGKLTRAGDHRVPEEKAAPPPLPGDVNAPARRALLWWGLGAGGLLIAALLLRPLARRRS